MAIFAQASSIEVMLTNDAIDSQKKIREAEGRVEWTGQ
jgi:hypothetical protein